MYVWSIVCENIYQFMHASTYVFSPSIFLSPSPFLTFPCLGTPFPDRPSPNTSAATHSSVQYSRLLSHGMRPIHATLDTHMLATPLIIPSVRDATTFLSIAPHKLVSFGSRGGYTWKHCRVSCSR